MRAGAAELPHSQAVSPAWALMWQRFLLAPAQGAERICVKGTADSESGLEGRDVLAGAEHKVSAFGDRVSGHGHAVSCRITWESD